MTITTLNAIRARHPCEDGWRKLLAHLGKTKADDEPLPLLTVLDSNGLDDALWVLDKTSCNPRLARHFGAWCAEQVLHLFEAKYPNDPRPRLAIEAARDDAMNESDRAAAGDAAGDAAWAAARDAARAVARAAAGDAARDAAGDAAWAAARAAARDAARAVARAAAGDAARDAVWAASWIAAGDAARAASWIAAGDAARDAQSAQLRKMLEETNDHR